MEEAPHTASIEVVAPGLQTTVQDDPGRIGYWDVGVPPSGPMDPLAFRIANRLLGNPPDAAGLEITFSGPALRFHADTEIALTGARMSARVDGKSVPFWRPLAIQQGSLLEIGRVQHGGCRACLAVKGGIAVPPYLGSRSTFILGGFGGHEGRPLRAGDLLPLAAPAAGGESIPLLPPGLIPTYPSRWEIGVIYGPHGAPDFFTQTDIETFFRTEWRVHHNSDRTGVRLIGPKPQWARPDGGEAGLHPSNIHDNAYAVGTVDFTGDMPVILGPDGPSLGGFVCPATIPRCERWKIGQLRPDDTVRFFPLSDTEARKRETDQEQAVAKASGEVEAPPLGDGAPAPGTAVIRRLGTPACPMDAVAFRPSGDRHVLAEYGPNILDLDLRFKVHLVHDHLRRLAHPGIIDLTPGIRSLQVHYDSSSASREDIIDLLVAAEDALPPLDEVEVPSRVIHLPLSWDDPATREAIRRYARSVRPDAPWCPSNIEFIRRINGLASVDDVRAIVFAASYLVMGLGDVYLGAPVATPLDPRHRLVTTKYNPARTWTPENAVGIGGAYLCIYGMEGPGGYQFVGRTLQMWNRFGAAGCFEEGKPWLLRFFDRIRFYPVSAEELLALREDFPRGRFIPRLEHGAFSLREHRAFLARDAREILQFKERQQRAFDEERARWDSALASTQPAATS